MRIILNSKKKSIEFIPIKVKINIGNGVEFEDIEITNETKVKGVIQMLNNKSVPNIAISEASNGQKRTPRGNNIPGLYLKKENFSMLLDIDTIISSLNISEANRLEYFEPSKEEKKNKPTNKLDKKSKKKKKKIKKKKEI